MPRQQLEDFVGERALALPQFGPFNGKSHSERPIDPARAREFP